MIEVDECKSVSLMAEDGSEITITLRRREDGLLYVSLYLDDGTNVSALDVPRKIFDQLISEMRTMQ